MRWNGSAVLRGLVLLGLAASPYLILEILSQSTTGPQYQPIALNELAQDVEQGKIVSIRVSGDGGVASDVHGHRYAFQLSQGPDALAVLSAFGATPEQIGAVDYTVTDPPPFRAWMHSLSGFLPLIFFGLLWLCAARPGSGSASDEVANFTRHRARLFTPGPGVRGFRDVAGIEEAKQELQEIVEFLKYPEKFAALGARIPRGVLLVGPPGTGKTLLARAVAGEAGVPFLSVAGSEFVEIVVGVGASRVRDLFEQAMRCAPSIVFVDEIDAIGRHRGAGVGSTNDEREQTLNQVLVQLDGFEENTNVIVLAATNRPDVLDPALLRPGRFDRQVVLSTPDLGERRAILEVHARGKPLGDSVDLGVVARVTSGFSGADLAKVMNEGALLAARHARLTIGMSELDEAIDRIVAGPQRAHRVMSQHEKKLTAYHEGGHAVVMRYLEDHDPLHKVSIVERGRLGGYTRALPCDDGRRFRNRRQLKATLAAACGGSAAEQAVFGEASTGVENDLQMATTIARKMVTRYGMSERLGAVTLGRTQELAIPGGDVHERRDYSDKTAEAIDCEVEALIAEAYRIAAAILADHRDVLERIAAWLVEYETLDGERLERAFLGS
jgi:cell division protease FtsH